MTRNKPIVITHLVLFFSSSTSSDENPCPFNRCAPGGGGAVEDGVGKAVGRLGGEPSAIALGRWTPCRLAEFVEVDLSELRASPSSSTIDVQIRSKNDTCTGRRLEVFLLHRNEDLSRGAAEFVGTSSRFRRRNVRGSIGAIPTAAEDPNSTQIWVIQALEGCTRRRRSGDTRSSASFQVWRSLVAQQQPKCRIVIFFQNFFFVQFSNCQCFTK